MCAELAQDRVQFPMSISPEILGKSKGGRKPSFSPEKWLESVYKLNTMNESDIARDLGVNRSTVNRSLKKPEFEDAIKKAEEYLIELSETTYTKEIDKWEIFCKIPVIKEWDDILSDIREVSDERRRAVQRSIWNLCKYMREHPSKLNINDVAQFVIEMRKLYYEGKKQPYGLAYTTLREGVRSYFTLMKHISGEYLAQLGIDKRETKGQGKYSKQRIPVSVRIEFEKILKKKANNHDEYLELIALAKWMYYTGTRISASLEFNFNERPYELTKNEWILNILDKGEKGGQEWDKFLTDFALEDLKNIFSERFNIPIDKLESELPKKTKYLFPSFVDNNGNGLDDKVRSFYKDALIESGLSYNDFPPCHIFRHTFAQDGLDATDNNFDLIAELGGWSSTYRLKKHYGEKGKRSKIRGLRKAMGVEIEEEISYELNWYGAQKREKPYKCPNCGAQFRRLFGICNKCKHISDSIRDWINPDYKFEDD